MFRGSGIRELSDFREKPQITVFNASAAGSIFKALGSGSNIICSEYFDDVDRGGYKNGILNQDLQSLTFRDESFDLVISEDVFEHVPDIRKGFSEVHRVLKNGGLHIFTIPYYFDKRTQALFKVENGKTVLFEPVEYHGDPIRGSIPCFTHFGYDSVEILEGIGFDVRIEISGYADQVRFGTFDCYTFITRKREREKA